MARGARCAARDTLSACGLRRCPPCNRRAESQYLADTTDFIEKSRRKSEYLFSKAPSRIFENQSPSRNTVNSLRSLIFQAFEKPEPAPAPPRNLNTSPKRPPDTSCSDFFLTISPEQSGNKRYYDCAPGHTGEVRGSCFGCGRTPRLNQKESKTLEPLERSEGLMVRQTGFEPATC